MNLSCTWPSMEDGILATAEHRNSDVQSKVLEALLAFGLVEQTDAGFDLTSSGNAYYLARYVTGDEDARLQALGDLLGAQPVSTAFCSALWGTAGVTVTGAVSLLRRLRAGDEASAKRWLELMNRAGWIAYNRKHPRLKVL